MKRIILLCVFLGWGCDSSTETARDNATGDNVDTRSAQESPDPAVEEQPTQMDPAGVETEANPTPRQPSTPTGRTTDGHWSPGQEVGLRRPTVVEPASRARRRMNLDQLEAAFLEVSGGLNWTERRGNEDVSLFQELSATLGKPDYIQITSEVLEPTALFQKFLDDAARQVCQKMLIRDVGRGADPVVLLNSADTNEIDEHLRRLILRFHGRALSAESRDLAQWRWLYDSTLRMTDNSEAQWNAVCVALFTHPDFYTY